MARSATVTLTRGRGNLADGWEYEVILPNGLITCSGWVRGSKREARAEAAAHAKQKGLAVE